MAWAVVWWPTLAGALLWWAGRRVPPQPSGRRLLGGAALSVLAGTLSLAIAAAAEGATATYTVGPGLVLRAELGVPAGVIAVLVAAVALVVAAWAAAHEDHDGLARLLGLMTAFVGAMELLVVAADLLSLTVGFELVGALSWALIGHDWRTAATPRAAAHAFNATRFGGLGLFLAAGAAIAGTGSLAYEDLVGLTGGHLHVVVGGVLVAALAKSAQGPFAPWLFSAMAGPTSVSALLHSSTMVAAGAYVLARLHPALDQAPWFAPTAITVGLATALAGGVVALLQAHAKKLLAASTSAQYGLMLVAVGAGYPAVALAHLVAHAVVKSQLFLSAGIAMGAVGSPLLGRMRLRRALPVTAAITAVASLGLAAVPPLGAAWSKEAIVAAGGHVAPWLALLIVVAGGLSAAYATRFHVLAYGPLGLTSSGPRQLARRPSPVEQVALGVLAVGGVALGALWLPSVREPAERVLGGTLAEGPAWELAASLLVVAIGFYATWATDRRERLGALGLTGSSVAWGDWLGLPTATRRLVVDPALGMAAFLSRVDDRGVDAAVDAVGRTGTRVAHALAIRVEPAVDSAVDAVAGAGRGLARVGTLGAERGVDGAVAAVAWLVDRAGTDARRTHTGMVHHQFVVIAVGLVLVAVAAVLGR